MCRIYVVLGVSQASNRLRIKEGRLIMLKIINISKSYPGKDNVFQNVEFEVQAGEICALLGNNGSGKSR